MGESGGSGEKLGKAGESREKQAGKAVKSCGNAGCSGSRRAMRSHLFLTARLPAPQLSAAASLLRSVQATTRKPRGLHAIVTRRLTRKDSISPQRKEKAGSSTRPPPPPTPAIAAVVVWVVFCDVAVGTSVAICRRRLVNFQFADAAYSRQVHKVVLSSSTYRLLRAEACSTDRHDGLDRCSTGLPSIAWHRGTLEYCLSPAPQQLPLYAHHTAALYPTTPVRCAAQTNLRRSNVLFECHNCCAAYTNLRRGRTCGTRDGGSPGEAARPKSDCQLLYFQRSRRAYLLHGCNEVQLSAISRKTSKTSSCGYCYRAAGLHLVSGAGRNRALLTGLFCCS